MLRRIVSVVFLVLISFYVLTASPYEACACTESMPQKNRVFPSQSPFSNLNNAISGAISRGVFRQDDFERLDFSLPGELTYGDNPEFEVFNPFGPFNANRLPDWKENEEMFTGDTRTVFLLRRMTDDIGNSGITIRDHLLAVITHLNKKGCEKHRYANIAVRKLPVPFDLTPSYKGVIADRELQSLMQGFVTGQCITDTNDQWYYVEFIASRYKKSAAEPWNPTHSSTCTVEEAKQKTRYCSGVYIGWQPKPDIVEPPYNMNLRPYIHAPPPTVVQRVSEFVGKSLLLFMWVLSGAWALSLLLKAGNLLASPFAKRITYADTAFIWLLMSTPWIYASVVILKNMQEVSLNWVLVQITLCWLVCATTAYVLFRRQKIRLVLNEWTSIICVIFILLAGLGGKGGCSNVLWPF